MDARRGQPRMTLDEAARQWHGPRRRHVERHAGEYLRAFQRHLYALWPHEIMTVAQMYGLAKQVQSELPCLCAWPFADPSELPMPPMAPSWVSDNAPPRVRRGPDGAGGKWEDAGEEWRRMVMGWGATVAVEHGGSTLHFGEHLQYMMLAYDRHRTARAEHLARASGRRDRVAEARPPAEGPDEDETGILLEGLGEVAMAQAREYMDLNPSARIVGAPPPPAGSTTAGRRRSRRGSRGWTTGRT